MIKIIAEIGWNHMGSMDTAAEMIKQASQAGVTHVKFQTWSVDNLKPGAWDHDGRKEIYVKAELTPEKHRLLADLAKENNVKFFTSVFSSKSVPLAKEFCDEIKVPSTELNNTELLKAINGSFKKVYVSTGASLFSEVEAAVKLLDQSDICLMHCISCYPCLPENANLKRIGDLSRLTKNVGYSGHCLGINDAMAAISLGATVIEKHFTIDRNLPGRDNKFALIPEDMKVLCDFAKAWPALTTYHGRDYLECEKDQRENYRGRWDKTN